VISIQHLAKANTQKTRQFHTRAEKLTEQFFLAVMSEFTRFRRERMQAGPRRKTIIKKFY